MTSQQDDLYTKMAHLSSKKQEGLRSKIRETLAVGPNGESKVDSILQQVIEWVDKEITVLCRDENNNYTESAQEIEIKILDKLLQLKEGKV